MALESATYISGLNAANPLGSDPLSDADGHLRLIKSVLKTTFPNIAGPVNLTHTQLNTPFPVGGVLMWAGSTAAIPDGFALCDGTGGTPDLSSLFATVGTVDVVYIIKT